MWAGREAYPMWPEGLHRLPGVTMFVKAELSDEEMSKRDAIDATRHVALGDPTNVGSVWPVNCGSAARGAHLYDGSFGGAARSALIDYLEAL